MTTLNNQEGDEFFRQLLEAQENIDPNAEPTESVEVSYEHEDGHSWLCIRNNGRLSPYAYNESLIPNIYDAEMNAIDWRQYGSTVKTSTTVIKLQLTTSSESERGWIAPKAVRCLQAFFGEIQHNTSIQSFWFDTDIIESIPPSDIRYFLQNNKKLNLVEMRGHDCVSPAQATHISTSLMDVNVKKFLIDCGWINDGSYRKVILACRNVKTFQLYCSENDEFSAVAELIRDPMTTMEELDIHTNWRPPNLNVKKAENDILASLSQNVSLKTLKVHGLFGGNQLFEHIANLICDTTSLESVHKSNHSLQIVEISLRRGFHSTFYQRDLQELHEQYLELNKNPDKWKVIQTKITQHYLSGYFDASPFVSMPLSALPQIFGIDIRNKPSAIFTILKNVPELCCSKKVT